MRDSTERPETVDAKTVKLVGTLQDSIIGEVSKQLLNEDSYKEMSNPTNPNGEGLASKQIVYFFKEI